LTSTNGAPSPQRRRCQSPTPLGWRRLLVHSVIPATSPERAFLAVGTVVGLLFVLAAPPFSGADEPAHLYRAYQVSEGAVLAERRGDSVGGLLPASLRRRRGPLRPDERAFVDFRNTALYPPVSYLPHAVAIGLGRAVELPPVALLYAGRMAGLATSLALVFLAIRITPIAKHVLLLLALTPMAIRQMTMLTADSVTIGTSFLFLALVLRLSLTPAAPAPGSAVASAVLCGVVVSLSKLAYLPLALLYLLGRVRTLGRRRYAIGFLALAGAAALGFAGWLWVIRDLQLPQYFAPDADPRRQLAHIVAHPIGFAHMLLVDLRRNWAAHLHGAGYAGQMPRVLGWLQLIVTAGVALADGRKDVSLDGRAKALIVLVFASTYVLIQTMNYLAWNPVGATTVQFVQPRYYIPIVPLPFLLVSNRRFASAVSPARLTTLATCYAVFTSLVALRYLLQHWYGV
jgi:uncharacterized membrane protein